MSRVLGLAAFAGALLLSAAPAAAQTIHAGVDVARLVPAGMEIEDVVVPDEARLPVRLALAPENGPAELLVDIRVASSSAAARRALAAELRGVAGTVPDAPGLGDEGVADEGYAAFARDNVMVAVRRIRGSRRVPALAADFDAAIQASPAGPSEAPIHLQLPDPSAMSPGDVVRIARPAGVLAMHVAATGDASSRRTAGGYLVTRSGSGTARLDAVVVDRRLRVAR